MWENPEGFHPERFRHRESNGFDLIAQGGADYLGGHRCAGEMSTVDLVKSALRLLTTEIDYRVPLQDLCINLSRMPALPVSGFVIDAVRPATGPH